MTGTFQVWAVLCLLTALGTVACESVDEDRAGLTAHVSKEPAAISVAAATAVERTVPTVVRATGTFVADESSDVTPQVPGQVIATPVNVGDMVAAGQVIVRLDERDARLKLDQVRASLQQAIAQSGHARAEATRYAQLREKGLISE